MEEGFVIVRSPQIGGNFGTQSQDCRSRHIRATDVLAVLTLSVILAFGLAYRIPVGAI
jgi:hypothetical protein